MKKLLYGLCMCLSFMLLACDKTTEDTSFVTYYVEFEMTGDEVMILPLGTAYVEPGMKATEQGQDVSDRIKTSGAEEIDKDEVGVYTISYSAINKDGYPNSTKRTVIVYDPTITADISGRYITGADTKVTTPTASVGFADCTVTLTKVAPGVFEVSDFLGGYYDQKKGYGPGYAMFGHLKLNADNTLTMLDALVAAWGDSADDFTNAAYDPNVGENVEDGIYPGLIKWTVEYAGSMTFSIVLDKPNK